MTAKPGWIIVAPFFACAGCGLATAPTPSLAGTWSEAAPMPGVRLVMTLSESGTDILGTGSYSVEAGRTGTLQVYGEDEDSLTTLVLEYDGGMVAAFSGSLTDANHLTGTISHTDGSREPATLVRR